MADRVAFVGHITGDHKRRLYANCLGVYFGPFDEDYGYVTLEAMLSAKPVITFRDSGGPCEFVHHGETGFVLEPDSEALAGALHELWDNQTKARARGRNGKAHLGKYCDGHIPEGILAGSATSHNHKRQATSPTPSSSSTLVHTSPQVFLSTSMSVGISVCK